MFLVGGILISHIFLSTGVFGFTNNYDLSTPFVEGGKGCALLAAAIKVLCVIKLFS